MFGIHFPHSCARSTFAVALGVSQGTDHYLPTGQTVTGVEVAQVTLGMDLLGLNDLERGKE